MVLPRVHTEVTILDGLDESVYKRLRTRFLLYRLGSRTLRSELSYTETPQDDDDLRVPGSI